jgi:uncharacterized membrane protein
MAVAKVLFWLALIVWLGAVVFFSFVVAPAVFRALSRESAGLVVGALFPRYYTLGELAGAIGLGAAVILWRAAASPAWAVVSCMLVLMLGATLYAGCVVEPRARVLRPTLYQAGAEPGAREEFERLHRLAVRLNAAVLVLGVASVCVAAGSLELPRR